jgi:cellulose synthase/poly-beta-1,6-N-acetylglucosamine synthase-like glycosyltransferase
LFVFVVPCLNEELVIGGCIERLVQLDHQDIAILVVDDGSDDETSKIVRSHQAEHDRVWLLRRDPPNARQGKGRALNAAFNHLRSSDVLGGRHHRDVILVVVDGDGRLERNVLTEVAPFFADPRAGAVQIGVRMYNSDEKLLARMQDVEFVVYTEAFQRGRQHVGSVGLGGNGQFCRLSALETLGDEPWTECLTEDLDIGIRLLLNGWTNHYCPTTHVSQQAVTSMRRLVRQRTRWFQGQLQCWRRIPAITTSPRLGNATSFDLLMTLVMSSGVLVMTLPMIATAVALLFGVASGAAFSDSDPEHAAILLALFYTFAFGTAPIYAYCYWLRSSRTSFPRSLLYAHVYACYSYLWAIAGWRAVGRTVMGRSGWAKTARTTITPALAAGLTAQETS